jgi:O-methyltransferase involved in polyketide biosynthesis
LWARGVESKKPRPIMRDPHAAAIVDGLDYDFAKFRHSYGTQIACVLRGLVYDAWVRRLVEEGTARSVVELGSGFTTRCHRLADLDAHWVDVDHADSIALRRRLLRSRERQTFLPTSILDPDLPSRIADGSPGPHCFVAEGVLMYLTERDVRTLVERLARAFPGACLAFDSISPVVVGNERFHDSMRHMRAAPFRWGISDVRSVACWMDGLDVLDVVTLPEIPRRFPDRVPRRLRLLATAFRVGLSRLSRTYRLSLARLPGATGRAS